MTAKELQKRNGKSENLRVLQTEDGSYFCESLGGQDSLQHQHQTTRACPAPVGIGLAIPRRILHFRCKHILSVINCIPNGQVESAHFMDRKKPKLDERSSSRSKTRISCSMRGCWISGIRRAFLRSRLIPSSFPTAENGNFAVCKATVVSKTGESFTDIGDANPQNCSSKVSKHLLRLASTRAIARALRSFTNIGMTCLEELADLNDIAGNGSDGKKT